MDRIRGDRGNLMQNNRNTTDRKIKLNLTKLLGIRAVRTGPGGYRPVSIMNRAS